MSGVVALRGEVWEVDLNLTHPCLVVSTDGLNRSRFGTVIVCPITATERANFVWRPKMLPEDLRVTDSTWKAEPHWIETDQIVTVDVGQRLIRKLAVVTNRERMAEVDSWLRRLLLPEG